MRVPTTDSSPPGEYYCPMCEQTFAVADLCPKDGTKLVRLTIGIDALIGKEVDNKYTIIEKLGQGAMGAVYRAQQHGLNREVALKVINPHLITDTDVIKRFLREAKLAGKIAHPNAVAVHEASSTADGMFYLVMELVVGHTLDHAIETEKQFRPERVVRIGMQVCDALECAHALQIVHRDLKPANIMLLSHGRDLVKVLDFGLAKSVAPDQTLTTMTNAGALLGTPAYMPPELARGESCDGRADLYSLGVILYELASGHLPFESGSAHELIAMHGTEAAPPVTGAPPLLAKVIDRLLSKDPADRFQSASETRDALEASLDGRYLTPLPFAAQASIVPSAAMSAELPAASRDMPRAAATDTIRPMSRKRRRWLVPMAAIVLAGGAATGAYLLLAPERGDGTEATSVRAAEPAPALTPAPAPTTTPPPPKQEPTTTPPPPKQEPTVAAEPPKQEPTVAAEPPKHEPPKHEPPKHEPPKHEVLKPASKPEPTKKSRSSQSPKPAKTVSPAKPAPAPTPPPPPEPPPAGPKLPF